jgi:hypothetical protein
MRSGLQYWTSQMITELDSASFAVRKASLGELEKLGDLCEGELRAVLSRQPSLEVRACVENLLKKLEGPMKGERLRSLRAIEVLERIGSEDAIVLLQTLAQGAPSALQTKEARATIARLLKKRQSKDS